MSDEGWLGGSVVIGTTCVVVEVVVVTSGDGVGVGVGVGVVVEVGVGVFVGVGSGSWQSLFRTPVISVNLVLRLDNKSEIEELDADISKKASTICVISLLVILIPELLALSR